ncbi:aminotransferase class I/II-fold pyridoxal phosphate-dependent enzyme [soil metagenome]
MRSPSDPSSADLSAKISERVRALPRSGIRDFFELVQAREGVISLGVGEPDFPTPWHIREAAIYSLERGETSYTSNLGLLPLREAIAEYVQSFFGVGYDPKSDILVTVGVSEALDLACRALIDPGDEVIYHEPCYVSYNPSITMAGGVAVAVETHASDNCALRASAVEAAITPRTVALMLNFPTNPTGGVQPADELEKIAALARQHDLIVITDEIYSELRYGDEPHISIASLPGMRERTILLHGFSKAYSMTGFRLGYACAPAVLTDAMMKIHQYSMLCASMTSQVAAIEALANGAPQVEMMRRSYAARRNLMLKAFAEMGIDCFPPGGAFYAFPDISSTGLSSKEFAVRFLEEEGVAVVPGDAFGSCGAGFVRCCYATGIDQLKLAMEKMAAFVGRVRAEDARRSPSGAAVA